MTIVFPLCASPDCLLAAVATILDKLTAVFVLVNPPYRLMFKGLTRAVDLGHHESSKDGLVERGVGATWRTVNIQDARSVEKGLTSQELIEADQKLYVRVIRLRDLCTLRQLPQIRIS